MFRNSQSINQLEKCQNALPHVKQTESNTRKTCCRRESARCRCNFRSI